jgi:glycosyltransferase involved in cell wall biosynthesis
MKIAQVAPLYESVPPKLYGGTERVVSYLTEELVRRGHDVTLMASGDSRTAARLVPVCETALRLQHPAIQRSLAWHVLEAEYMKQFATKFDVIHSHADFLLFPQLRQARVPAVTTMHLRLDVPDLYPLFKEFSEMGLVSISNSQRAPMPWANWIGTVYHGLPEDLYAPGDGRGGYLAFLGRVSPEKGLARAIDIAKQAGMLLRVAAKIDPADEEHFESAIKPRLSEPHVEWVGEINDAEKSEFLGNAAAALFPIEWPEPFGLVMIESLACGTPVIAFRQGSVPEIVEDSVTGFVVNDAEAAADCIKRIPRLSRARCRESFVERFSVRRMCDEYQKIYERVAEEPADSELDAA